ncbi:sensor histidine kinase [Actinotalea sp. K2]|uniref:sensor histidine kinase n=1 Tax=Actinotalea sp. K2 TaxID=2939438 RepID=UPI002018113B|nr:sensor histidine kinase [Actinotalea sp. K2]MCL3860142.1 ATP-binding protein [Actinotalea sp. K2]
MSPTPEARAARAWRTSLRRRLRIALVTAGTLLVLVVAGAIWALALLADRQQVVTHLYFEAITEADAAYVQLVNAETAVRGYALTGDPITLEPFHRLTEQPAGSDIEQGLAAELGEDHRVLLMRSEAGDLATRWYREFAQPTIEAVEEAGPDAVGVADIEEGRVLFDELRVDVEAYADLLRDERDLAVDELGTSTAALTVALGLLAVAPVVVGVLLWVFLRRWVTGPLAVLAQDARIVAGGDVDHPVVDAGPGEVGEVARDVELMRERLVRLAAQAAEARAALESSHELLQEQAEELRRSNRDLEQFAYVASHDLQEPLRKVASFTQLLQKRYQGQLDDRADQYIDFAVDGAKRMQRLINDLLGFSRVGRIGGELTEVDMGSVVERASENLGTAIEESGAVVTVVDLPVVRGEEPLLVQLVQNLIGNAIKFRHPDRVPEVRIEAHQVGGCWEFACRDNGIGIDPQYADRVFVIFQRLHAKDVYEGTGIGLALCKKIVEFHGGDIWVTDASPGTVVRWTIPVGTHEEEAAVGGIESGVS